ncbi:hypothetical protein ADUPG1_004956, partial [Aduncisulcus paluster]
MILIRSISISIAIDYIDLEELQLSIEKKRLAEMEQIQTSHALRKEEEEEVEDEESEPESIIIERGIPLDETTIPKKDIIQSLKELLQKHQIREDDISAIITDRERLMVSIANQL